MAARLHRHPRQTMRGGQAERQVARYLEPGRGAAPRTYVGTWWAPLAKQATAPGAARASTSSVWEVMQPSANPVDPGPWRQTATAGCACL